ncbi:MAG: ABC transporter ATP-binding protein [Bacteroidales bacterium]
MTLIKDIRYYFSVFKKHLGNRLYFIFFLTILVAATEAFGITLILPLIEMVDMDMGNTEVSGMTIRLKSILSFFGIGDSMVGVLAFMACIFLLKGLIKFIEGLYKAVLKANLQREIKSKVFDYYSNMNYDFYSKNNTGHFVNIITGQVNRMIISFEHFNKFISEIIITITFLGFAFILSWEFAIMAAVAGIIILFLFRQLNAYVKMLSVKTAKEQSSLNKFLVQTLHAWKYVTSTSQMRHLGKSVYNSISKLTVYMRNQGIANGFTLALKEPVSVVLIIIIIIIQINFLEAPLAPIFVSLILIHRAMGHVMIIQSDWQHTMNTIGSLVLVEEELDKVSKNLESNGKIKLSPLKDSIQLNNISFAYNDLDVKVLEDINLTIKANTTVAFVGESGAGKSTLIDMLTLLLKANKGDILIDGVSHKVVELNSWRSQIGYVSQDTVVFDDTIANNISMWRGDYDNDSTLKTKIELAAEKAYALKFINELPQGFNTVIGDRGIRLSGGQKQRLFIARELFKKPRFLILDEATSALDSESEKYIKESIDNLKGLMTVVIIAHRLSTIRNTDYIFVLDKGRIIEKGTYDELVASGQSFNKMVELQSL